MSKSFFYRILEATFLANQAWHHLIIKLATELTIITKKKFTFSRFTWHVWEFFLHRYFLLLFSRTKKNFFFSSSKKNLFQTFAIQWQNKTFWLRNCILAPTSFIEITFTLTKEGCPSLGRMSRRTILEYYILFYQKVESHKKSKYIRSS